MSKIALTNNQIIDKLRTTASGEFNERIPTQTKNNIEKTVDIITQYPTVKNEFIVQLTNLVGRTIFLSKLYENPLKFLKKGTLEYGKTIEAVFIDLIKGKSFNENYGGSGSSAAESVFSVEKPNVKVEYYSENFRNKYKISISDEQLKGALRSERGLADLIQRILISPLNSAEFDEYLMVKQVLNNVTIKEKEIAGFSTLDENAQAKKLTKEIKTLVKKFRFMSDEYNNQGVKTFTRPDEVVIFVTPETSANIDVELLASAFNLDKVELEGRLIEIDSFTKKDTGGNVVADPDTLAIVCDYDLVQFHETLNQTESIRNPDQLTTNTWVHRWGIMAGSGFVNAVKLKKTVTP